ncbi:MAG: hypothetical protein U0O25_07095 [Succinivibrio sp.]|uniref:Uncharacterized protein n=1 Tax=Succinivibrio faecicola TaxID=2820300 RepID=A0ABS7DFS9_9GAMM|nr:MULTISPECIES: hypothetical protein [Succinivibrio]MBW7569909.1 hypothetical protein [Succinivibrio faecicola]MDD6205604.1 hypothetical protein [Succinivibrio sp.]
MININFAQTLFSSAGSVFVVLSILFFLAFRKFRFAILTLLLANALIWTAIVFPKSIISLFEKLSIPESILSINNYYLGVALGFVLFVLWFILAYLVRIPFKKKNEKQESSQNQVSSDEESNKDTAKLTDESISAEDNKEPLKKE